LRPLVTANDTLGVQLTELVVLLTAAPRLTWVT
jgi:hypothetical protein